MNTPRSQFAFTLIELLVVISIIGILASLALPAISGAMDSARRTQAKNDVVQIATAVTAYETEYGKLPGVTGSSDFSGPVNSALVQTLTGQNTTINPRAIVFIEVQEAKPAARRSGTNESGFIDPWGNPYQIAIDGSYDNTISAGNPSESLRKKVAVWSNPTEKANRRAVSSWK